MSSYIVDYKTINRILSNAHALGKLDRVFKRNRNSLDYTGRELLRLNIDATEQRYPDKHYLTEKQKEKFLNDYTFKHLDETDGQCLKSLQCLTYQCSEGNIPKRQLYKDLENAERMLMHAIVVKTKEYSDSEWG